MIQKIGDISYDETAECEFKQIYKGNFKNHIKVRVRLVESEKVPKKEVEIFIKLNSHPNVQRLYGHELKDIIHYFALQDFSMTLKDFIKLPKNKRIKISPVSMIKDITEGLKFLHDNKIVHSNISYTNVGIDKENKRAVLCNCGLDDLQEDIFITPEELSSCEEPSFEADIFNLGVLMFYILSNGKHPFDSFQNSSTAIKNIKEMSTFKCNPKDFVNIIRKHNNKFNKSTYQAECAIAMLKKILQKNPSNRLKCNEILDQPFFWCNYKIYDFFMKTNSSWTEASEVDKKLIDEKGFNNFKMITTTYQLASVFKGSELKENDRKSLVKLVNAIASKIKHFEDELNIKSLNDCHILYYLQEFPFLLSHVYDVDKEIFSNRTNITLNNTRINFASTSALENIVQFPTTSSHISVGVNEQGDSSNGFQANKTLYELFNKANLPPTLIINKEDIKIIAPIKTSNADVYYGKFKDIKVAIKKIRKSKFKISEVKAHFELSQRKSSNVKTKRGTKNLKCYKCKMEECENVIKFYGCYEEHEFYCLILEKAEMDLKDFIEKSSDDIDSNEQIKRILFDAVKGLECLHANHISHLDIKPQNILVVKRNGKLVGCLADFGESVAAIKKTYTKTTIRITDGYVAPELLEMAQHKFRSSNKDGTQKSCSASIRYSKCDIYSLGMVIMRDYVKMEINDKTSTTRSLSNFRRKGKINFLCEELANFMTETSPIDRPDVEGVRKNPFFWTSEQQLEFLKTVDEHGRRHAYDQNKKKEVIMEGKKKLIVIEGLGKYNLVDFFKEEPEIQLEIKKYLESKNKDSTSVFVLVELIIYILTPESFTHFPQTKEILQISNLDSEQTNLDNYLKFWFSKFELIAFLYYKMQEDLKILHHKFYSMDSPIRSIARRRMTIDGQNLKRRHSVISVASSVQDSENGTFKTPKRARKK